MTTAANNKLNLEAFDVESTSAAQRAFKERVAKLTMKKALVWLQALLDAGHRDEARLVYEAWVKVDQYWSRSYLLRHTMMYKAGVRSEGSSPLRVESN